MLWMTIEDQCFAARSALSPEVCEQLLAGIAQGQSDAFEAFYRQTARSIYAYALSLTRNAQNAQDAMMETYLAIRTHADRYAPCGKPLAWVFTIARNAVRMQQRAQVRELPLEELAEDAICVPDDRDAAIALREAMRILSEQEREIVTLHAVSGLRHREIAQALSLPLSTVLSKYTRALKKLRKRLSECDGEEGAR